MKIVESQNEFQLELPGIKLEQNQLTVLRELTPDETRRTIFALHAMDDSMRFWVGDFLVHASKAHCSPESPELGKLLLVKLPRILLTQWVPGKRSVSVRH